MSRRVEFPDTSTPNPNDSRAYTFLVAGDLATVDAEIRAFNGTLIWSFLLLGLGLVVAILLQVRVGLLPLRRLKEALHRIRDGKAQQLEGDFPAEIAPLAEELNSLIEHSAEIVARAAPMFPISRIFSKTPLDVLASEAEAVQSAEGQIRSACRSGAPPGGSDAPPGVSLSRPRPCRRQRKFAGQPHPGRAGA